MKVFVLAGLMAFSGVALAHGDHASHGQHHGHDAAAMHMSADIKTSTDIQVSDCWIRSLPAPAPSAGYFLVKNGSKQDVKLQSAVSTTYGMIMLHQTTQHEGMSKMSEAQNIVVPAAGQLEFKPGGYHAMLEQARTAPQVGSQVAIDFLFDNGEKASAQCEVRPANATSH